MVCGGRASLVAGKNTHHGGFVGDHIARESRSTVFDHATVLLVIHKLGEDFDE